MVSFVPQPRLEPKPTQLIDRSSGVVFEFDGRSIQAHEGDTIASALYSAGVRTFSRSFKYHRPRGLMCVAGRCPNCLMTVDGIPSVRVCTEPVRAGMNVRHQNAWPSLEHDALSFLDRLGWLLPVGFYYKALHRPKLMWRIAEPIIRRLAGLGSVDTESNAGDHYHHEYMHADVAVIGGGPSGMSAALAAAGAGARVVLIDDQTSLGGHLRFDARTYHDVPGFGPSAGFEIGAQLAEAVHSSDGIEVLANATAFGLYEGNLLGVLDGSRMVKLRAKRVVIATGSHEVPTVFEKNDLPGVMLSSAAQRLMHLYGVKPGSTAVVATSNDQGYYAALDLAQAGLRIVALADSRPDFPRGLEAAATLQSHGVPIFMSHAPSRAEGYRRVLGAVIARLDETKLTTEERQFDCDFICTSGGYQPASYLLHQAGATLGYDREMDEMVPRSLPDSVYSAGEVTGIHDPKVAVLQGRLAGAEAASSLRHVSTGSSFDTSSVRSETAAAEASYRSSVSVGAPPMGPDEGAKKFVCFCEDVTSRDLEQGIDEGFQDIQTLKRYSTVTMGPCQGKMCMKSTNRITAQKTGRSEDEIGVITSRPPVQPVPLGALAGPSHMPIKLTSIYRKHIELGAKIIDMTPWKRPYSYGSPQEESLAVRERVGIIDVSTLGKIDVRGRDAPALLDKIYTNRFSDLRVGRIRYGIMCSDDGTIIDDGTVTRLAEDQYFVTTSTGNIELVEEWIKWWMAGTGMCAHVTNLTAAYAAINVAGPKARDTLVKLTDVDLSPEKFRYMRSVQADVAGVPTLFLRIGFVGEAGWELHFPAEYGEYMWDTLLEAGKDFGISPFGVEAQRILRLEKKHIIVTQDTDAVTNPLEGDAGWAVKFDKEDFIGRGGLVGVRDRGLRNKLVGFVMRDGLVPDDGAPVVVGSTPIGRVTSSRLSPTLGKGFGLAWVPAAIAEEGAEIYIHIGGQNFPASITLQPVYDPEGKRLRS